MTPPSATLLLPEELIILRREVRDMNQRIDVLTRRVVAQSVLIQKVLDATKQSVDHSR